MLSALTTVLAAEETHHEVNSALSWGIGAAILALLFAMIFGLVAFGSGREHS